MMIRIGADGAPADISYFDETTGSEVHAKMMPHLLHEARAARTPVVMPLNIQGANGDLHCNLIHFIGSKIERFDPRGNIR